MHRIFDLIVVKIPDLKDRHLKELLSGSLTSLILKVSSMLIVYLFTLALSWTYGPEAIGLYSFAVTIIAIAGVFGKVGFDTYLVRFLAREQNEGNWKQIKYLHRKTVWIAFLVSFALMFIFFLGLDLVLESLDKQTFGNGLIYICLSIPPAVIITLKSESFRGLRNIRYFSLLQNNSIFFFALIFFLGFYYFLPGDVQHVSWAIFGGHMVAMVFSIYIWRRKTGKFNEGEIREIPTKKVLDVSLPMLLTNSAYFLMMWTDRLMVGFLTTDYDLGIYEVALKISNLTTFPLIVMNAIVAPKIAQFYHDGEIRKMKRFSRQATYLIMAVTLPVIIFIMLFPSFLLGLFGEGEEFLAGRNSLLILVAGQLCNAVTGPVLYILNMSGREKTSRNILVSVGVINLVINSVLIPRLHIEGAAIATAVSTLLWNGAALYYVIKYFKFSTIGIGVK